MKLLGLVLIAAGVYVLSRMKPPSSPFMSTRWLNEQERETLRKARHFECAPVDWSRQRFNYEKRSA